MAGNISYDTVLNWMSFTLTIMPALAIMETMTVFFILEQLLK